VFTQAAKVGRYPLNTTVTKLFADEGKAAINGVRTQMVRKGIGHPTNEVVGVYNRGTAQAITSPGFKAIVFIGFNGTFEPKEVVKQVQSGLRSTRVVPAGPHGGQMVCGYNDDQGHLSSECVWATKTTLGIVQFMSGEKLVKQAGAPALALQVRNALEVRK
jgi:hypothetical protein